MICFEDAPRYLQMVDKQKGTISLVKKFYFVYYCGIALGKHIQLHDMLPVGFLVAVVRVWVYGHKNSPDGSVRLKAREAYAQRMEQCRLRKVAERK